MLSCCVVGADQSPCWRGPYRRTQHAEEAHKHRCLCVLNTRSLALCVKGRKLGHTPRPQAAHATDAVIVPPNASSLRPTPSSYHRQLRQFGRRLHHTTKCFVNQAGAFIVPPNYSSICYIRPRVAKLCAESVVCKPTITCTIGETYTYRCSLRTYQCVGFLSTVRSHRRVCPSALVVRCRGAGCQGPFRLAPHRGPERVMRTRSRNIFGVSDAPWTTCIPLHGIHGSRRLRSRARPKWGRRAGVEAPGHDVVLQWSEL